MLRGIKSEVKLGRKCASLLKQDPSIIEAKKLSEVEASPKNKLNKSNSDSLQLKSIAKSVAVKTFLLHQFNMFSIKLVLIANIESVRITFIADVYENYMI